MGRSGSDGCHGEGLRERGMGWTRPRALFTRQVSPRSRQPSSSQIPWKRMDLRRGGGRKIPSLGCCRVRVSAAPEPADRGGGGLFQVSAERNSLSGGFGKPGIQGVNWEGSDRNARIPAVREADIEPPESTLMGPFLAADVAASRTRQGRS